MTENTRKRRREELFSCKTQEEYYKTLRRHEAELCKDISNSVDCPDPTIDYLELTRLMYPEKEEKVQSASQ